MTDRAATIAADVMRRPPVNGIRARADMIVDTSTFRD
jgi:hypothetical protein